MNRDVFLAEQEPQIFEVEVAGLGRVRAREVLEAERVRHYDLWLRPNGELRRDRQLDCRLKLITLCMINDAGELFLTDADIPALRKKPSPIISQLVELAMKCAGLSEDDMADQLKKKSTNSESPSEG